MIDLIYSQTMLLYIELSLNIFLFLKNILKHIIKNIYKQIGTTFLSGIIIQIQNTYKRIRNQENTLSVYIFFAILKLG